MFESLCILGRQSGLSLAELESLFGSENIKPIGKEAALVNTNHKDIPFQRLGGSIKLCKVLTQLDTTNWTDISKYLVEHVPKHVCCLVPGKVKFGISVHGLKVSPKAINATGLEVKKASKAVERSMRVVPNKEQTLNAAQVLNNKMTNELGMELILIKNGSKTILAQTTNVQDIDAYAARDQGRPKRDARVGMLPPKLAQIIVNLAVGDKSDVDLIDQPILDPFCGTGVILQEALLMGFQDVQGADIDKRMVEYTIENLEWLPHIARSPKIEVGDATNHTWLPAPATIACETYLGQPFSAEPRPEKLSQVIQDVNTIHKKFLQNVAKQKTKGFRMCIAVPAWHTSKGVKHLPVLDQLTDMGYTRMSFVHAEDIDLIYHREGQIVGRELLVLIRK